MNEEIWVMSFVAGIFGFAVLYKLFKQKNPLDEEYKDILTSDKYKVKGQYET